MFALALGRIGHMIWNNYDEFIRNSSWRVWLKFQREILREKGALYHQLVRIPCTCIYSIKMRDSPQESLGDHPSSLNSRKPLASKKSAGLSFLSRPKFTRVFFVAFNLFRSHSIFLSTSHLQLPSPNEKYLYSRYPLQPSFHQFGDVAYQ